MVGGGAGALQGHTSVLRGSYLKHTLAILRKLAAGSALAAAGVVPAFADAPSRVVSINLCTDQLAMMLAAPGQLVSVSHLARDPLSSSMVAEAAAYAENRGQAEQVFLMQPDLVLAGTYTSLASVNLLRGLGIEVLQVPPVNSLDEVADQILIVGQALGREDEAKALVAEFRAGVDRLTWHGPTATAALYYPNGYTTGAGTLADDVLAHTGFHNIGATAGLTGGGTLPLERLVMAEPDVVVTSAPYPGASRSEEMLTHPALTLLRQNAGVATTTDADWICGNPHILRAMQGMLAAREALP
ncbi:ABC transporter substrate-binding protein [Rhodobacter sp.]